LSRCIRANYLSHCITNKLAFGFANCIAYQLAFDFTNKLAFCFAHCIAYQLAFCFAFSLANCITCCCPLVIQWNYVTFALY
jgi:hypothetical protein